MQTVLPVCHLLFRVRDFEIEPLHMPISIKVSAEMQFIIC